MKLSFPPLDIRLGDLDILTLPQMFPVRQHLPDKEISDSKSIVRNGLAAVCRQTLKDKQIAITAGSRGITGIGEVLKTSIDWLKEHGADVFVVPAMGSHGGATARGQVDVLSKLGLTEEYLGVPIRSSMDVVSLGKTEHGLEVFCDKAAYNADGIVVCNRIKAHNVFKADYESGLVKMLVVGLGKHHGALAAHNLGFDRFGEILPTAATLSLSKLPILAGIGILENAYGKLAGLDILHSSEIVSREPELLKNAKQLMGRLLVDPVDVLIIDEIGKDISGGGLDANVTGRSPWGLPGFEAPAIKSIIVRDLSKATDGNSIGIGLADFTTRRCVEKIDLGTTYTNSLTARSLISPKIPVVLENDRQALDIALRTLRGGCPDRPGIVRIKNTKELSTIWLSEVYKLDIDQRSDLSLAGSPQRLQFDKSGTLVTRN